MSNSSFYTESELSTLGFRSLGQGVLISRFARFYRPENISIGDHTRIDDFCILSGGQTGIVLGRFIHIACYSAIFGSGGVRLDDFSCLSSRVVIYSESDDFSGRSMTNPTIPTHYRPGLKRAPVVLERHALVGTNSSILPGVTMGEGSACGAHSLLTCSCDPWVIYVGTPAKRAKARDKNLLELEARFLRDQDNTSS